MQREVENPLALKVLAGEVGEGDTVRGRAERRRDHVAARVTSRPRRACERGREGRRRHKRRRCRDLFATAVHRFGSAWADLVVATAVALGLATVPVLMAWRRGRPNGHVRGRAVRYGVAYFLLLGHVMLRGLPAPAHRRVAATF